MEKEHKFEEGEQVIGEMKDYYCVKKMIDGSFTGLNKKETILVVRYGYMFEPEKAWAE